MKKKKYTLTVTPFETCVKGLPDKQTIKNLDRQSEHFEFACVQGSLYACFVYLRGTGILSPKAIMQFSFPAAQSDQSLTTVHLRIPQDHKMFYSAIRQNFSPPKCLKF